MQLIVLDQDATREFGAPVDIWVPGATEPQRCTVTYLEKSRDQLKTELGIDAASEALTVAGDQVDAFLRDTVRRIDGLVDADKQPLTWSEALWPAILARPYIVQGIITTYTRHILGGERSRGN